MYKGSEIVLIPYFELETMTAKVIWKVDSRQGTGAAIRPESQRLVFPPGINIVLRGTNEEVNELSVPPLLFDPVYRDIRWLKRVANSIDEGNS